MLRDVKNWEFESSRDSFCADSARSGLNQGNRVA